MSLRTYFLDAGQADAAVLVNSEAPKTAIVIDCGDAIATTNVLRDEGVERIELILLSHGDQDHIQGVAALVQKFAGKIGTVAFNYDKPSIAAKKSAYRALVQSLIDCHQKGDIGALVSVGVTAEISVEIGLPLQLDVLYPTHAELGLALIANDANLASCVVVVRHEGKSILFPGDLPGRGWAAIEQRSGIPRADILKFPHHGAQFDDSGGLTLDALLTAISPGLSIIPVGTPNQYGHPASESIAALRKIDSRVMCTQATSRCASTPLNLGRAARSHLEMLPTRGARLLSARANHCPCAGTVVVELSSQGTHVTPSIADHDVVIDLMDTPLCRR